MKRTITVFLFAFAAALLPLKAQISKGQVIMLHATAQADGINLTWPSASFSGNYIIFRRDNLNVSQFSTHLGTLASSATSFKDVAAVPGKSYEYWVVQTNGANAMAFGYIYAGNNMKEVPYKGGIVLLIDSNYRVPLAGEIDRLSADLNAEGWIVSKIYAGRKQTPVTVRATLVQHIKSSKHPVSTVMLIGHIPVPYSGGFTGDMSNFPPPDGHKEGDGDHTGAWPADGFYGDMDGVWTDTDITMTTGSDPRNKNVPGDGKFDPTKFPGTIELEVGRIDLYDMPAFGLSDTVLTRNYLNRNHLWRTGQTHSLERALIDDNFPTLNLASTGFHNFSAFFTKDSIFENRDYMTTMKSNPYLWSLGCGAGWYTSCNGVGNTNDFAKDSIQNIFTSLSGSFFGDWDYSNSLLKAPLCKAALGAFWGGIPKWYVHTMGMGKHIGFGTRVTQNNQTTIAPNTGIYFSGQFNYSDSSIHIALMGDPTLCNRHLPPVKGLSASSANKQVLLKWNKSMGIFDGYAVYRVDTATNIYTRVSKYTVKDTVYNDSFNYSTGDYIYVVRTIKKETTASGSYYNLGGGSTASVKHVNAISTISKPSLHIYPNPSKGIIHYNDPSIHGFEIYDMMGRQLDLPVDGQNMQLDISSLPQGNYILRCLNADNLEISMPVIRL